MLDTVLTCAYMLTFALQNWIDDFLEPKDRGVSYSPAC